MSYDAFVHRVNCLVVAYDKMSAFSSFSMAFDGSTAQRLRKSVVNLDKSARFLDFSVINDDVFPHRVKKSIVVYDKMSTALTFHREVRQSSTSIHERSLVLTSKERKCPKWFLSMAYGVTVRIVTASGKHKRTATWPQRRFRHWFCLRKAWLHKLMYAEYGTIG